MLKTNQIHSFGHPTNDPHLKRGFLFEKHETYTKFGVGLNTLDIYY